MRLHLSRLEDGLRSDVYKQRLRVGWAIIIPWLVARGVNINTWADDSVSVNQLLSDFVNEMFVAKVALWRVKHAVLAVQTHWFNLRYNIPRAWDAIRSWQLSITKSNRTPCPLLVVKAIFGVGLSWGLEDSGLAHFIIPLIILIRVGFWCLLRPGEMLQLTVGDILFHNDVAVITIRQPKNRRYFGRSQFAVLRDVPSVLWLKWLCKDLPPSVRLFPSNANVFRKFFKLLLEKLGASGLGISPAGLRPGGCTHYFLDGVAVATLRFLGRWASDSSLNCYIQEAMSVLVLAQMGPELRGHSVAIVDQSKFAWLSPPSTSWLHTFNRRSQWRHFQRKSSSRPKFSRTSPRMQTPFSKVQPRLQ